MYNTIHSAKKRRCTGRLHQFQQELDSSRKKYIDTVREHTLHKADLPNVDTADMAGTANILVDIAGIVETDKMIDTVNVKCTGRHSKHGRHNKHGRNSKHPGGHIQCDRHSKHGRQRALWT